MAAKLLIATKNQAKFKNFARLLAGYKLEVVSLSDLGLVSDVAETGTTFEENAKLKVMSYFALSKLPTLVDDSGLEIDALGGWPGLYSRRVWGAGEREATDEEALAEVLQRMEGVPDGNRSAHFTAVVALALPTGEVQTVRESAAGIITHEPHGPISPGFPYRTIFYLPEVGKTAAQLEAEGKYDDYLSHRKKAILKLEPYLRQLENYA
ncbi:MAG: non-canonical purine NTP pyrophosphatase [Candidatus Veblenbacteria bacterium]|nr:non-canonical purine NTP pyrophosphatase [Candidatus Veblenbacteria bacterium]